MKTHETTYTVEEIIEFLQDEGCIIDDDRCWCCDEGYEDEECTCRGYSCEEYVLSKACLIITQLLSELREAQAERKWQPIETAPKDGTTVLFDIPLELSDGRIVSSWYWNAEKNLWNNAVGQWLDPARTINGWMPLPQPPTNEETSA